MLQILKRRIHRIGFLFRAHDKENHIPAALNQRRLRADTDPLIPPEEAHTGKP